MDYQSLHIKTVVDLRQIARRMGVKIPAGTNKTRLIEMLLEAEAAAQAEAAAKVEAAKVEAAADAVEAAGTEAAQPAAEPESAPEAATEAEAEPEPEAVEKTPEVEAEAQDEAGAAQPADAGDKASGDGAEADSQPASAVGKAENRPDGRPRQASAYRTGVRPAGQEGGQRSFNGQKGYAARPQNRTQQGDGRYQRYGQSNAAGTVLQRGANPRYSGGQRSDGTRNYDASRTGGGQRSGEGARYVDDRRSSESRGSWETAQPRSVRAADAASDEAARYADAPDRDAAQARTEQPYYNAEYRTSNPAVPEMLAAGECGDGAGVLELQPDGYGFLRAENCSAGPNDVYISIAQIRRFCLRSGDYVEGKTRPQREGDRYSAMMYITRVNGMTPEAAADRPRFEDLVPIYPTDRLRLESPAGNDDISLRLIDMLAPIGKGQRGMIVSQPKAGKTTLLKKVANAITAHYPEVYLIVLLIDERPEEVTDMQRSINGEVVYSTFDEAPENHTRVAEMVLDRAQRLVEMGRDVVVLMDSITRLARAYNLVITPTGRSLSGGLDPGALFKPKRFFGAARNIENGGSLTIIATALVDTGSRMDDIIFEEFKGTGNMELHLDRKLSDRRVFPAIDLLKSGTRREELLLDEEELNGETQVRKMLTGRQQEMYEQLVNLLTKTETNAEFFQRLKGWLAVYEREGYTLGK